MRLVAAARNSPRRAPRTLRTRRGGDKLRPAHMLSLQTPRRLFEKARARFAPGPETVAPHVELGRRGEALAAEHLCGCGYELVAANFKLPVGRNRRGAVVEAELDIVAYEGPTLCFVEVKTRRSDWFAAPEANVDLRKQRQVTRAARAYRRLLGLSGAPTRFDVVTVILPQPDAEGREPHPRVELLRAFWSEEKFRKRRWGTSEG